VGLSPYNAPGVFSLLAATELIDGVWYPVGGFGKVGEALAQVAQKAGAEIHTNVTVASIDHKAGKVMPYDWDDSISWNEDVKEDTAAGGFLMRCLLCSCCFEFLRSCYYLCNLVVFVKVNGWNSQNIFSLTLHVFWIGFCNCIGIYVVSFFIQL
jgi:hypothetical protein